MAKKKDVLTFEVKKGESINAAVKRLREAMEAEEQKAAWQLLKKHGYAVGDLEQLDKQLSYAKKVINELQKKQEAQHQQQNQPNQQQQPHQ